MSNCRNMEEIIATSLYETLDAADHEALHAHLAGCDLCRQEYESLKALVGAISADPVVFQGDLLPVIREELRRSMPRGWFQGWKRFALGLSTAVLASSIFILTQGRHVEAPTDSVASYTAEDPTLANVRNLVAADRAPAALAMLNDALANESDADRAGLLQLEVADLEFSTFRRYDAAYRAYRIVRDQYADAWTQSPGIVKERYDLLTEAQDANFEPLYQIDTAAKQGESGLPALERIMARYPGRSVARAATETMLAMTDGEGLVGLENVRERLSNPVAVAQLDVRLGEGYCAGDLDPAKGKALLRSVADGPYEVPAQMAKNVLARLEAGER